MCQKYVLASELEKIESRFNVRINSGLIIIPKLYTVSPGEYSYVLTSEDPHELQVLKFGMTPFYATQPMDLTFARAEGDKNMKNDPNYNGSKSIFLQTAFRKSMQYQRCLIIADAYYEWSDRQKPYLVYLQNRNRPFAFAGIYDRWTNPESNEIVESFAVITTVSNSLLRRIGVQRMPVILSRSNELQWIKASNHLSDVLRLLNPYPAEKMNAYPISEMINMKGINDPLMLNPIGDKLQLESNPDGVLRGHRLHREKSSPDKPWFKNQ